MLSCSARIEYGYPNNGNMERNPWFENRQMFVTSRVWHRRYRRWMKVGSHWTLNCSLAKFSTLVTLRTMIDQSSIHLDHRPIPSAVHLLSCEVDLLSIRSQSMEQFDLQNDSYFFNPEPWRKFSNFTHGGPKDMMETLDNQRCGNAFAPENRDVWWACVCFSRDLL